MPTLRIAYFEVPWLFDTDARRQMASLLETRLSAVG
jgi:hypothetical protein